MVITILATLGLAAGSAAAAGAVGPASTASTANRASAAGAAGSSGLAAGARMVCPASAAPGVAECQSVIVVSPGADRAPAESAVPGTAQFSGYSPAGLRTAYGLSQAAANRGGGETIAIVDAYNDPRAVSDLAAYRGFFHLPRCSVNSGCLRIVNQAGRAHPLPGPNVNWAIEESLDLDMVSAICPHCHILLVEAQNNRTSNLGKAEDAALAARVRFVSNSWSSREGASNSRYDRYFDHAGDALVFASGDTGYGTAYPADTQYVTSVGGTSLQHVASGHRAWTERVWGNSAGKVGTGSGCSPIEAKPTWQHVDDTRRGCLNRTENDVSAVADPATGVAIYDSYGTGGTWFLAGGTSAATPIITAVYALAGVPERGSYPASYLYAHASHFFGVTSGVNGRCPRRYLCHGQRGYNGPAGLGTPNGIGGFLSIGSSVTLLDPGTQRARVGAAFSVTIHAVDTRRSAKSLAYRATGLPAGLRIRSVARSLNAVISGRPTRAGTYVVTVTSRDAATGRTDKEHFTIRVRT